jgi:hypothetical protein
LNGDKSKQRSYFVDLRLLIMNAPKNIAFTKLIKINGRLREFNFRKRPAGYYDVNTNDERGNRFFFKLEQQEGEWTISDQELPAWLIHNKPSIVEAVQGEE